MTLTALIDKQDSFEIVRDQIATILATETASQQALATADERDPQSWKFRVFAGRNHPFAEYEQPEAVGFDASPLVNVLFDSVTFDKSAGDTVERQQGETTFNIDCYAYGEAADDPDGGHVVGDEAAALNLDRCIRLVRNILMASEYEDLQQPNIVGRRWIASITHFVPELNEQPVQNVLAARIALEVLVDEFSPQYAGEPLEVVSVAIRRDRNNELICEATFPLTTDS